jgi:arylsulfatase A-like enzyme
MCKKEQCLTQRREDDDGVKRDGEEKEARVGNNFVSNTPLSGTRGTLWEGGIRVPFIFRWPDRIPAGRTYDKPLISLDIYPTVVTVAGGQLPEDREIDGVDLMPHLTGARDTAPHDVLFWRYRPKGDNLAIRRGNLKLPVHRGQPAKLFDLAADIGGKHGLSEHKQEVAQRPQKELMAWNDKMPRVPW